MAQRGSLGASICPASTMGGCPIHRGLHDRPSQPLQVVASLVFFGHLRSPSTMGSARPRYPVKSPALDTQFLHDKRLRWTPATMARSRSKAAHSLSKNVPKNPSNAPKTHFSHPPPGLKPPTKNTRQPKNATLQAIVDTIDKHTVPYFSVNLEPPSLPAEVPQYPLFCCGGECISILFSMGR